MKNPKTIILIATVIVGLYFLLSTIFKGMYTIQSGTVGVLVTFGKFSDDIKEAGLHFKVPFVQEVKIVDVKLQTVNYTGAKETQYSDGVIGLHPIAVLDSKNLPIDIDLTVQYVPIAEQAKQILADYGVNYFEKYINPAIRNLVRDVIGKYHSEEIAMKRAEIAREIEVQLIEQFKGKPFRIEQVGLRNINLPPIILDKIKEVQLAKQEEQRLGMVEQQAQKNQEIKTIEANTKLIEVTTQAKADAEKKRIEADAKAYQITAEAKANAEANKLLAQSLTRELIDYLAIQRWEGSYPQTLIGSNPQGGLLLTLPNTTNNLSPQGLPSAKPVVQPPQ